MPKRTGIFQEGGALRGFPAYNAVPILLYDIYVLHQPQSILSVHRAKIADRAPITTSTSPRLIAALHRCSRLTTLLCNRRRYFQSATERAHRRGSRKISGKGQSAALRVRRYAIAVVDFCFALRRRVQKQRRKLVGIDCGVDLLEIPHLRRRQY